MAPSRGWVNATSVIFRQSSRACPIRRCKASPFDRLRVTPSNNSVILSLSKETRAKIAGEGVGGPHCNGHAMLSDASV